jgi:hypothetical protein
MVVCSVSLPFLKVWIDEEALWSMCVATEIHGSRAGKTQQPRAQISVRCQKPNPYVMISIYEFKLAIHHHRRRHPYRQPLKLLCFSVSMIFQPVRVKFVQWHIIIIVVFK